MKLKTSNCSLGILTTMAILPGKLLLSNKPVVYGKNFPKKESKPVK